jgi:hypothetical protein
MRLLLPLVAAGVCAAAVVPRFSFEELVDTSERIVQGRVERSWVAWDRSRQFIWTHYEIAVSDMVKGAPSRTVIVSEPGGALDGMTLTVPGAPRYATGEEVVLFLHRTPIGYLRANGYEQGCHRVRDRARTARLKDRVRSRLR